ncbi:MAG: hypothetical protein KBS35_00815 [Mycoplasma sp.]|nr:hypothetical protein [Candidatus Hennigella equi]
MNKIFNLLTLVSNYETPLWAKIAIQVSMWLAVVSQIFLLVPDMMHVIKTKDTRENKWFKWIVWFVCSAGWIAYSVFLTWENIPIMEVVGLAVSEGINLVCLFIIYGIKIYNIVMAKKFDLTEAQWCSLLHTVYIAKKTLSNHTRYKLKKACKDLSTKEKIELYINALRKYNVAKNVKRNIKRTAKKVAKRVIRKAKKKRA